MIFLNCRSLYQSAALAVLQALESQPDQTFLSAALTALSVQLGRLAIRQVYSKSTLVLLMFMCLTKLI